MTFDVALKAAEIKDHSGKKWTAAWFTVRLEHAWVVLRVDTHDLYAERTPLLLVLPAESQPLHVTGTVLYDVLSDGLGTYWVEMYVSTNTSRGVGEERLDKLIHFWLCEQLKSSGDK